MSPREVQDDLFGPPQDVTPARVLPPRGATGRELALAQLKAHRPQIVAALRTEAARIWRATQRPVSVNDVRPKLEALGYGGDPRILGAVFHRKTWRPYGYTTTDSEKANARSVRTFIPQQGVQP